MIFITPRIVFSMLAVLALVALLATKVLPTDAINLAVASSWGTPEFNKYTALNQTREWRYSRDNATLIITEAQCPQCKAVTQQDIDECNQTNSTAIMLKHRAGPAMLRLTSSPKGQMLRTFQLNNAGVHYRFQLGINDTMSLAESFALEQEFFSMVDSFMPD
jgi:hypothetical protein